jgi:hypothetical protein
MATMWAVPKLYVVELHTNYQQCYEYSLQAYSPREAKYKALRYFGNVRLKDEIVVKAKVNDPGLKAF